MFGAFILGLIVTIVAKLTAKEFYTIYQVCKKAEKLNSLMGQAIQSIDPLTGNICNGITFVDKKTIEMCNRFDETINLISQHNQDYLSFLDNQKKAKEELEREEKQQKEQQQYEEMERNARQMQYERNLDAVEPNMQYASESYIGQVTSVNCPFCNSPLVRNNLGQEWCSCKSCNFGLDPVYFDDEKETPSFIDSAEKEIDPVLQQVYQNYSKSIEEKETIVR